MYLWPIVFVIVQVVVVLLVRSSFLFPNLAFRQLFCCFLGRFSASFLLLLAAFWLPFALAHWTNFSLPRETSPSLWRSLVCARQKAVQQSRSGQMDNNEQQTS